MGLFVPSSPAMSCHWDPSQFLRAGAVGRRNLISLLQDGAKSVGFAKSGWVKPEMTSSKGPF